MKMSRLRKLRKRKSTEGISSGLTEDRSPSTGQEDGSGDQVVVEHGIHLYSVSPKTTIIEEYWIDEPFARILIGRVKGDADEETGVRYYVDEIRLTKDEQKAYRTIVDILTRELSPPDIGKEGETRTAIVEGAKRLIRKYKKAFRKVEDEAWSKILYYLERDMLGYGQINAIMNDPEIEDVSCDGIDSPIFVWHRKYESIPTNIVFKNKEVLDDYIVKLAHKSGKHVSSAFPIVDAMLHGKHRLAASFRDEISPKGSTFTIRKFRDDPLSIIDLITLGTITEEMAAYFWVLLEHRATIIVLGGTGSGKTTTLNALASLIKPGMKIVTVEETAELNLPHENWVQLVSRESFGLTGSRAGQISLFDLVRMSLRYRPDYLVVGEVRGEEAFVLFQALATGHGGLSTMHADNLDYGIKRLTSPPMNISETYIPLMNVAAMIERVPLNATDDSSPTFGRRMRNLWEVKDLGEYINVSEWEPSTDTYVVHADESYILGRLAAKSGTKRSELMMEMERRKEVLSWMVKTGKRGVKEVSKIIAEYYSDPESTVMRMNGLAKNLKITLPETDGTDFREEENQLSVTGLTSLEKETESMRVILELVDSSGGVVELEKARKMTKLDAVAFWKGVDKLKRSGVIVSGERSEDGGPKTYLVSTRLAKTGG